MAEENHDADDDIPDNASNESAAPILLRDLLQSSESDDHDATPFLGFARASDLAAGTVDSEDFPTILRTACGLPRLNSPSSRDGATAPAAFLPDPRVEWRLYGTSPGSRIGS